MFWRGPDSLATVGISLTADTLPCNACRVLGFGFEYDDKFSAGKFASESRRESPVLRQPGGGEMLMRLL